MYNLYPFRSRRFLLLFYSLSLTVLLAWQPALHAAEQQEWLYPMQPGDNLWNITERYLVDMDYWKRLVKLNGVKDPRKMPPGTTVKIPLEWLKLEKAAVRVVALRGKVTLLPVKGSPRPLASKSVLHVGDGIVVGPDSEVLLQFEDSSRATLSAGTRVFLRRVQRVSGSNYGNTTLEVLEGGVENSVPRRGTRFEIRTPAANTTVRGTRYRVGLDAEAVELTRVEVLGGVVNVFNPVGRLDLEGGFGTLVARDEKPRPPVKLLAPPLLDLSDKPLRSLPLTLDWKPVAGAAGYQARVFVPGEPLPLLEKRVALPHLGIGDLPDGGYELRVLAIDANGLKGREGTGDFVVDARPVPPLAIRPTAGSTVRTPEVTFEWSTPPQAESYLLQVSDSPGFSRMEVNRDQIVTTRVVVPDLATGTHYWRVATRQGDELGPWSTVQTFNHRPAPASPTLSAEGDESTLVLHWQGGEPGQRFRVQMSEDQAFSEGLVEKVLDRPQWSLERPRVPVFFRVRVIDVDGYEGPWSPVQKVFPPPEPWYFFGIPALLIMLLAL